MDDLPMPPIECCPRELLENIFLECLPPSHEPDRSLIPLQLSHVCARWRTIASQLPPLWRSLYIVKKPTKPTKYNLFCTENKPCGVVDNLRKLTELWAANARDHTLSIHFEMHCMCSGFGELLADYAHRIRFLRFQVLSPDTTVHAFEPFLNDWAVDQMEALHLTWNYGSNVYLNSITTFDRAPKLRKLRLGFTASDTGDAPEPSFASYYWMIDWAKLTHVCVDNISVESWSELVRSCRRLEECLVTLSKPANSAENLMLAQSASSVPDPTSIPHLRTFGINLGRSGGLYSFESLDLPALETLQISAKPWSRNERARKFEWRDSLAPTYQWLKNLSSLIVSLQDMSTQVGDFVGILPCATSLKNLSVYYIETGSDVETILQSLTFDPMAFESIQQVTLPKLRHLKLEMATTYDLRPATQTLSSSIRDFAKCRWWTQDIDSSDRPTVRLEGCDIGMMFFRERGAKMFFDDVECAIGPLKARGLRINVYKSHCNWACDEMTNGWW